MNPSPPPRRQRGAVLIIGLLLLLVLSLIGVTAMTNTGLEERMAGYARDRNTALQAAELALREAERYLENLATLGEFSGDNGLYRSIDTPPDWRALDTWSSSASLETEYQVPASAARGRYFIRHIGAGSDTTPALNVGSGYGTQIAAGVVQSFFITARGVGANAGTEVILRSYYGRRM